MGSGSFKVPEKALVSEIYICCTIYLFIILLLQYVSEVVIGAPYSVTAELLDHLKVQI